MSVHDAKTISFILEKFLPVKELPHLILLYACESNLQLRRSQAYMILILPILAKNIPVRKEKLYLCKFLNTFYQKKIFVSVEVFDNKESLCFCKFCATNANYNVKILLLCRPLYHTQYINVCLYHKEILIMYTSKWHAFICRKK
jgi:hypothetical protein